jgi:hypothetical protein
MLQCAEKERRGTLVVARAPAGVPSIGQWFGNYSLG